MYLLVSICIYIYMCVCVFLRAMFLHACGNCVSISSLYPHTSHKYTNLGGVRPPFQDSCCCISTPRRRVIRDCRDCRAQSEAQTESTKTMESRVLQNSKSHSEYFLGKVPWQKSNKSIGPTASSFAAKAPNRLRWMWSPGWNVLPSSLAAISKEQFRRTVERSGLVFGCLGFFSFKSLKTQGVPRARSSRGREFRYFEDNFFGQVRQLLWSRSCCVVMQSH